MKFKIKTSTLIKSGSLIVAGILIGWLFFGGSDAPAVDEHAGHDHGAGETEVAQIWTCSMHPQIRQNEPGDCPICGMDLIPLAASGSNDDPAVLEMSESAMMLANIQTQVLELGNPEKIIYLNGKIKIDERNIHNQTAHIPGRIEQLYINFTGQKVSVGQKIASIYSPELVNAQKELFEAIKLKSSMPRLYQLAVEKLKLLKITDSQISKIENSGKIKNEIDILADASGYVINLKISSGSQVKLGEVLFETADLSTVWVVFDVYEKDISRVKLNSEIDFKVSSQPGKNFTARVAFIDPVLDSKERTIKVRAKIRNSNNELKPEMFVKGVLKSMLKSDMQKIIIPKSALMWTGKRSVVYVKVPDSEKPAFEMREITIGDDLGEFFIVESGLEENEEIVVNGTFKIDAAAQLNGNYSSMNRPAESEKKAGEIPDYSKNTPKKFKSQLKSLILAYIKMTDALVLSDSKKSLAEAKNTENMLGKVDMSLLSHSGHKYWMTQSKIIKKEISLIAGTDNIEAQRKAFTELSEALIRSAKAFGTDNVFYVVHCPMANDNAGGNWLSLKNEVLNPYFGDMMLHCGEVVETVKK
ncbi:MAG: efflux RND transporter periplasmic adaptor subunit [Candidatus Kapabacteria bacterium]|jgi:Cu(I)/Ag(I) efflux system membrane fusion protein|nr:efflux RND transporter periplasmic adaptor subunit [Candidatus Kapabacteria bacterium]